MDVIEIDAILAAAAQNNQSALTEADAKRIFKAAGMPVVSEIAVKTAQKAADAARELGFPVVLKGFGSTILHKTEAGLVCPGLATAAQVETAARKMTDRAGKDLEGFLVQPMVQGKRELVAGMFRDPQFGPVVMFGLGGIFTEAIKAVVFKIAPLTDADMDDMLTSFPGADLLNAFRGESACDLQTLKTVLKGLSDLALSRPEIREIDINPLIIAPDGRPVAVDGLIALQHVQKTEIFRHPVDLKTLGACFYPETIAFVGASATIGKWGHMLPTNTLSRDYKGRIYLVNPKGAPIMGRPVFRSVSDIPEDVDLAVVTVPARHVKGLIPELAAKNVKGMLLVTSGFREVGETGAALEKEVVDAAAQAGILVLGPNTMGLCNPHVQLYCTAAHAYPLPGSTALVCQSGNMGTQLLAFAEQQDIGIRAFSGSGNEAMVTIEDYMEAFEIDALTRTVVLYIESVKDGRRFFNSARRVSQKKPVVVLKGGRTEQGKQAAASHTGAMASNAKVFDAACRQSGIIQVEQPLELLDLSAVFSSLPLPSGNRVAIMTLGGGWGVVAADLCAEHGLIVPPLPEEIIDRLNRVLPDFWSHGNPVDIVGEGNPDISKNCLEELLKWDGCDAVIHLGIHGKRVLVNNMVQSVSNTDPSITADQVANFKQVVLEIEEDYTRFVVQMTHTYNKPVLGVSLLTDGASKTLYRFDDLDYKGVFFASPERAVKCLSAMHQYQEWRHKQG
ncbi:acetate--CoA ligase family protein [Desulfotignum phosphitoxidans]|uniref:Acyl-CoA synthetase, NAD(P) forming n=2 Tax=Desulfotignum TaxID=115780 RepID=S0FTU7_9BACT|nr:acetate--CoA ligase family protein [Desulfotignum phosphitoxidans]EMS78105.1 acyl-CoA synthetase, NAD(P) forming [Desulfotignum phosphitoxidans DSM 13687]